MTDKTYRAGIIGLGFIGGGDQVSGDRLGQQVANLDGNHFEALSRNPRLKLVAGSSRDPGRRLRFEERSGVRTYSDWNQMLAEEQLDFVSIASYAPSHAELVNACAANQVRAIFCEKPIATRLPDAERMVQSAYDAKSLLVINHNRRFHPHFREISSRIARGELGTLTGGWLNWPTGRLGNVGTHLIDAALMLTGQRITSVSATLDLSGRPDCRGPEFRDPGGWAMLRLEHGAIIHVHAPDYSNAPLEILFQGTLGHVAITKGVASIQFGQDRAAFLPPVLPETETSMDRAVAEMIEMLDEGRFQSETATGAVQTLEVIVACHASHACRGKWIDLPLLAPDRNREVQTG